MNLQVALLCGSIAHRASRAKVAAPRPTHVAVAPWRARGVGQLPVWPRACYATGTHANSAGAGPEAAPPCGSVVCGLWALWSVAVVGAGAEVALLNLLAGTHIVLVRRSVKGRGRVRLGPCIKYQALLHNFFI